MPIAPPSPLGLALADAVTHVRRALGDPVAPVAILTPSEPNAVLARQQLALAGNFVRVEPSTPERLIRDLGRRELARRGLRPEPAAWLASTVGGLARSLDGPYASILGRPGWRGALARAVETLEAAGVGADALEALDLPEHRERLRILARLLSGVAERRRVDRLYAMSDLCDAALGQVGGGRFAGAVLLGDRLLAPRVHQVVRAWLGARPHVEVLPPPWDALDPAPMGLRAASSGDVLPVVMAAATASDRVALARTPDEVRELGEAARVALDAIAGGTPLDAIAIVLPDARQVTVLRDHLDRAGVPATWLTGPPLATTAVAGFLVHALAIAGGEDTVPAWYDLLRQPGLRLRAAVGADVTEKRGRWRRILRRCGAVRQTRAIVGAVQAWAAGVDEEGDRASAANLVRAIEALDAVFQGLAAPATLGEHARRWSAFLERWWVPSPDREQVRALLAGWGAPGIGAPLPLEAALTELRDALGASQALEGSLSDPAVRVATPMTLLGGAFDVVIVTGLTEGRLPRRPTEDPILPDALLASINQALGTSLLGSRDLGSFETRRFASIVSACTGSLWLSAPATELLKERPLLPSSFLLDVASARLGRRARYRDLADLQQRAGSRARPWPDDPDRAVHALEHRVATTALDPEAGLRRLALHATAQRLLDLHRGLETRASVRVPPRLVAVPGLDGEPLAPWRLARLLDNPAAFFVWDVLGVRRPTRLYGSSDPTLRWFREAQVLEAFRTALDAGGDLRQGFEAAWDAQLAAWREHRVDVTDADLALVKHLALQDLEKLLHRTPRGDPHAFAGSPVHDLMWVVEGEEGWRDVEVLTLLARHKGDAPHAPLIAMASPGVTDLRVVALDGVKDVDLAKVAAEVADQLREVTGDVERGLFPLTEHTDVSLNEERLS